MTSCTLRTPSERHHWKIPQAGDRAVVCELCGRMLSFDTSEYRIRRRSILLSVRRRHSENYGETFTTRLISAEQAMGRNQ